MSLLTTPLHAWHVSNGAKMAEFAGWDMPIQYPAGIIAEHMQTRTSVGLFDICHMGEFIFEGENSGAALSRALTINCEALAVGRCRYGFLLNEEGGIIDDLIVYRLSETRYMVVVNAACRSVDFAALCERTGLSGQDLSDDTAKIDIQGPESVAVLEKILPGNWRIPYFSHTAKKFNDDPMLASRTGYTGELGFELYVPAKHALALWERCLSDERVKAAGLGARDTLRLEAGLPLNGHDIGEDTTPAEAGYTGMLTSQAAYTGKAKATQIRKVLTGLALDGRRSARHGDTVLTVNGEKAGVITSGSYGPSVGHAIALASIDADKKGAEIYHIQTAKSTLEAKTAPLPFYTKGTARVTLV